MTFLCATEKVAGPGNEATYLVPRVSSCDRILQDDDQAGCRQQRVCPEGGQGVGEVGGTLVKQQLGGGAGLGGGELVHVPGTGEE